MAKRIDRMKTRADAPHTISESDRYFAKLGEAVHNLFSGSHDDVCRTLAMTDWKSFSPSDAAAAMVPLASHEDLEIRQLVALQLSDLAAADDLLARRALAALAFDSEPLVRREAMRSDHVLALLGLTSNHDPAINPAENLVESQQDGPLMTFTYRPNNAEETARLISTIAAWKATGMADRTEEKAIRDSTGTENDNYLPDMIFDEDQIEIVDLPRYGTPKDVLNVTKASDRLPDLLIED
jgi:hypothetical protein